MNVSKALLALMLAGAFGAGSLAVYVVRPAADATALAPLHCSTAPALGTGRQLENAPVQNRPGKDY